jgi:hypothetical protein
VIEERAILAALERIARMQDSIRSGMDICRDTGLVFLRVYYEQLPPNVARRLTELHAEDMAEIPRATSTEGTAQDRQRLGEKLASDAATAQVMRAMNVYRARLGYGPQEGGDGTEAAGGDYVMPKGKKRLTQREKAERAAIKKQLQADGVLPPDKPRLNRKKFAREVWEDFSEMDVYTADFYLRKAIMATVGPELHEVTSEQVGILKLMKLAVETDRFMQQLKKEGREQYSIGEYVEKVYNPVMNL